MKYIHQKDINEDYYPEDSGNYEDISDELEEMEKNEKKQSLRRRKLDDYLERKRFKKQYRDLFDEDIDEDDL